MKAPRRKPQSSANPPPQEGRKRRNRKKQPTQHTPMQRVMIVGPTGKKRFEWRVPE